MEDGGAVCGLTDSEMAASMKTLQAMADALSASLVVVGSHLLTYQDFMILTLTLA